MQTFDRPRGDLDRSVGTLMRVAALCAAALSLGGCYSSKTAAPIAPSDYRDRHPIALKQGEHRVEVFLSRDRGGLTPSQRADVLAFAQSWRRDATGGIVVDVPTKPGIRRAADDTLREIHSIFAQSGIPRGGVNVTSYDQRDLALPSIRLNYPRLVAEAGPCGRWPEDLGPGGGRTYIENRPFHNFGCASQRNLAAMVDNPSDLVQARAEAPAYSARRSVALDKYRKGENPAGVYENYGQGKISDLGK